LRSQLIELASKDPAAFEVGFRNLIGALSKTFLDSYWPEKVKTNGALALEMVNRPAENHLVWRKWATVYRDMDFALNLVPAYCFALQKDVDLFAIMGLNHVPGVGRYFKSLVGDKVTFDLAIDPDALKSK
jgi:hypothetical protein